MPTIADAGQARLVTGGVDTHADVHVAGMAGQAGRVLGTREFPVGAENGGNDPLEQGAYRGGEAKDRDSR